MEAGLQREGEERKERMSQKMLVLFSSTYVCEHTFSIMNINKASHRSKLTDQHLRAIL
ncbi:hypothetical protein PAMP_012732 [Pampus punctatissimus]